MISILHCRYYNFNEVQMFTFSRRIDEGGSDITVSSFFSVFFFFFFFFFFLIS